MVNFFNPGKNRDNFGGGGGWNFGKTSGQYYGGPTSMGGNQGGFGGSPSMTNWQPPARGNYPGIEGPASQPPQTGGPLPPFGGGNTASGGPSQPGGSWMGGNPGVERPGTYGVNVPGMDPRGNGRPPGFLGNPGLGGGAAYGGSPGVGGSPGFGGGNPGNPRPRFGGGRPLTRGF